MAKRPYPFFSSSSSSSVSSSSQNPNKLPAVGGCSRNQVDQLLASFLSMADSPSFPLSLDCAFDRISASAAAAGDDADQAGLVDRAVSLGSLLIESAYRCGRKRASVHNSLSWPLPSDLTIKVFSILDTQSLIYAAASCSMFHKYAMEPLCYSHIDLTAAASKVNNAVVSTMIQRAGKQLRSFKLGCSISWNDKRARRGKESSILTSSCLDPLYPANGTTGTLLRRLHLYNIWSINARSLCEALSACPHLIDLKIVGLNVELKYVLGFVTDYCHLIECLFCESFRTGRDDSLEPSACEDFVSKCPNLTSLALRGFNLQDMEAQILVKGFCKLKYLDLSRSYSVTGHFLRDLGNNGGGNLLGTLVLRDCLHLKEVEVFRFLTSILAGDFVFLRHIDISNKKGLACESGRRSYQPNLRLEKVLEERPAISILADFPELSPEPSSLDLEQLWSDESSDMDLSSEESNNNSLGFSAGSWESNYGSDQSIGIGWSPDSDHVVDEESSEG